MAVVHYDNGECFLMPMSGRHTVCLCGQSMQDSYKPTQKRKTTDENKVTCKNCLKKMEKGSK